MWRALSISYLQAISFPQPHTLQLKVSFSVMTSAWHHVAFSAFLPLESLGLWHAQSGNRLEGDAQGKANCALFIYFGQEGHKGVPLLNDLSWWLAHFYFNPKLSEVSSKGNASKTVPNQIPSTQEVSLQAQSAQLQLFCSYSNYYRCSCSERAPMISGLVWGWTIHYFLP